MRFNGKKRAGEVGSTAKGYSLYASIAVVVIVAIVLYLSNGISLEASESEVLSETRQGNIILQEKNEGYVVLEVVETEVKKVVDGELKDVPLSELSPDDEIITATVFGPNGQTEEKLAVSAREKEALTALPQK